MFDHTKYSASADLLAALQKARHSTTDYEALLSNLPMDAKVRFSEMSDATLMSYAVQHVRRRLQETPGAAKLLKESDVTRIVQSVYANTASDREYIRKLLQADADRSKMTSRNIRLG